MLRDRRRVLFIRCLHLVHVAQSADLMFGLSCLEAIDPELQSFPLRCDLDTCLLAVTSEELKSPYRPVSLSMQASALVRSAMLYYVAPNDGLP